MSTLAEQVVEQLKTDMDNVHNAGYQKGVSETDGYGVGYGDGQANFGIPNEVKGTNIVTCDYVNENEHNVEVKLSSDTVTDFSGVEVKIVEVNLLDYMQVVRNYESRNYENVNGYYVTSLQFKPNTTYYIKVNGTRCKWTTFLISTQQSVNGSQAKSVGISNTWNSENCVTTDETGLIYFGLTNSPTGEISRITQSLQDALVQIETGMVVTPYAPYTETTYTANADGTLTIPSVSPVMNLICNGVDISAKYYCAPNVEWHRLWDTLQQGGNFHFSKGYAFCGEQWTNETFKPKYPIKPTNAICFFEYSNIKGDLREIADIDFAKNVNFYFTFGYSKFTTIGVIDARTANSLASTFIGSTIETIERLILKDDGSQALGNVFNQMELLENITFEGVIGKSVNFQWSSLLSDVSVQNIIDCLADLTGQASQTITVHAEVEARMTEEQKATITSKNWTLAVAS